MNLVLDVLRIIPFELMHVGMRRVAELTRLKRIANVSCRVAVPSFRRSARSYVCVVAWIFCAHSLKAETFVTAPGVGAEAQGMGAAILSLDTDPRPECILMAYDNPRTNANTFRYRLGRNLSKDGVATEWTPTRIVTGMGEAMAATLAAGRVNANAAPDLIVVTYAKTVLFNQFRYRIGFDLNSNGVPASWSPDILVPTLGDTAQAAGAALTNLDADSRPELVLAYRSSAGWRYIVGWNLSSFGFAVRWDTSPFTGPTLGQGSQGGGIAVGDLDGNGRPDLILLNYEAVAGTNPFRYQAAMNLQANGSHSGFGLERTISGVGNEAQGAAPALAMLDASPTLDLTLFAYDNPAGENSFRYKVVRNLDPSQLYPGPDLHAWLRITGLSTSTGISVAGFADNRVYAAAVSNAGQLVFSSSQQPDTWTAWTNVAAAPVSFGTPTTPLLLPDGDRLLLLARGNDNNLYLSTRLRGGSAWGLWQALTVDASVNGRITAALTRTTATSTPELHVAYVGVGTTHYRRFTGTTLQAARRFNGSIDLTVGSNGTSTVLLAARLADKVDFYRLARGSSWNAVLASSHGAPLEVLDISNIVYYAGGFHVAYSMSEVQDDVTQTLAHMVRHVRIGATSTPVSILFRDVYHYSPGTSGHPLVEMAVFRQKLLMLMRDEAGMLRAARFDNADPALPWTSTAVVSAGRASHRPSLAMLEARDGLVNTPYNDWRYGDELIAGVRNGGSVYFNMVSRTLLKEDLRKQINVFQSDSNRCVNQSEPLAPTPIDLSQEGRPYLAEAGQPLWWLPGWFINGFYQRYSTLKCSNGDWTDVGRTPAPCSSTRLPLIAMGTFRTAFVCGGAWVGRDGSAFTFWEELGHYAASNMGLQVNQPGPTAADASRVNISLGALQTAYSLFTERTGTCPTDPRCRGFVGYAGNYESTSREHSFLYLVSYYVQKGTTLRSLISQDLAAGDNLLQRKYNWAKENLFRGLEYNDGGAPRQPL